MNEYKWKHFVCDVIGHKGWYKPHPYSSAWQKPKHLRPPMKCTRCGQNEEKK